MRPVLIEAFGTTPRSIRASAPAAAGFEPLLVQPEQVRVGGAGCPFADLGQDVHERWKFVASSAKTGEKVSPLGGSARCRRTHRW